MHSGSARGATKKSGWMAAKCNAETDMSRSFQFVPSKHAGSCAGSGAAILNAEVVPGFNMRTDVI